MVYLRALTLLPIFTVALAHVNLVMSSEGRQIAFTAPEAVECEGTKSYDFDPVTQERACCDAGEVLRYKSLFCSAYPHITHNLPSHAWPLQVGRHAFSALQSLCQLQRLPYLPSLSQNATLSTNACSSGLPGLPILLLGLKFNLWYTERPRSTILSFCRRNDYYLKRRGVQGFLWEAGRGNKFGA